MPRWGHSHEKIARSAAFAERGDPVVNGASESSGQRQAHQAQRESRPRRLHQGSLSERRTAEQGHDAGHDGDHEHSQLAYADERVIEDRKSERDVEFNNGHRGDDRERRPGRASPKLRSEQRGDPANEERDQESGRNADRGLGK
jgi:hypothetical protein